jgi:lipopolysaccharide/colanic/teichoic acid biosynthesis glycosyltransferase
VKRALDIIIAGLLILLCAPLMAAVALAVKWGSPGPVVIKQERVGRNHARFHIYKFRSMVTDAETLRSRLLDVNEAAAPLFKIRRDPRITRVGRVIRRFSLDELPQLVNVLIGSMSLVGPRPPFAHEVDQDYLRQVLRLKFLPGMTGLWQVSGRSDLDYDTMIRLDLRYTRDWSIWMDIKVLLRTVPVVISGKGAC